MVTSTQFNDQFYDSISVWNKMNFTLRFISEHFFGKTFLNNSIQNWASNNQSKIYEEVKSIEKQHVSVETYNGDLSARAFSKNYVKTGKPVVIKGGAKNWQACQEWGFEFFKENYGDHPVTLTHHKDLGDDDDGGMEETNLRNIIDGLAENSKKYARFNPLLDVYPELLESLDRQWLNTIMGRGLKNHHVLFIGNKGTKTNIHNAGNENIFVQLRGKKRWLIWHQKATYVFSPEVNRAPAKASHINPNAPDLENYASFEHLPVCEIILEEGDILFVPSYLWHYVENLTPTIGIGIRWLSPGSTLRNSPLLACLELFNTSPSVFKTLDWRNGFDFNKIILANLKKSA
ncbi:MAG: cupin-like domain-containing protein [Cytophagales bacterium]|nr:cupin-like domain-containing protein [Cytophagales bacterium]